MAGDTPTATSGSSGAGQLDPFDSSDEIHVISFIVRQMIAFLDTMKLCKVTSVHGGGDTLGGTGTVDVQLLVNQIDGAGNATEQGVVYGIPWTRYQGGKNAIVIDPVAGDIGYVVCSDRDISAVKSAASGGKDPKVNPGSYRRYNVADGVYVGCILQKDAPEQYVHFMSDKIKVVDKTGNMVEMTDAGIILTPKSGLPVKIVGNLIVTGNLQLGGLLQAEDASGYTGNIATTGDVTAGGKSLKTHIHSQPNDSHGDTEQNTSEPL